MHAAFRLLCSHFATALLPSSSTDSDPLQWLSGMVSLTFQGKNELNHDCKPPFGQESLYFTDDKRIPCFLKHFDPWPLASYMSWYEQTRPWRFWLGSSALRSLDLLQNRIIALAWHSVLDGSQTHPREDLIAQSSLCKCLLCLPSLLSTQMKTLCDLKKLSILFLGIVCSASFSVHKVVVKYLHGFLKNCLTDWTPRNDSATLQPWKARRTVGSPPCTYCGILETCSALH